MDPWHVYVCTYVCVVFVQFLQVNPTVVLLNLHYPHFLLCTITNFVITRISLHCTAWLLEPDSFVLRLASRCRLLAILKHRRSVPLKIGHYRTLQGTAGNGLTEESPNTSPFKKTKRNELVPRNQFMDTGTFSFLGPFKIFLWNVTSFRTAGFRQSIA
jgi:hypothetical protein